jgi:DUF1680 family protein
MSRAGLLVALALLTAQPPLASSGKVQRSAVPYFAWANRGPAEMLVWIKR